MLQVHQQSVVPVDELDPPGQAASGPPPAEGAERFQGVGMRACLELLLAHPPTGPLQHMAAAAHPGQAGEAVQGAPGKPAAGVLVLERAQEPVEAEAPAIVVGGAEPRQDLPVPASGTEHHPAATDGDQEVADGDLVLLGRAAGAEEGNLQAAQPGAGQDVAQAAFGQVDDLREQGVGPEGLLPSEMLPDLRLQVRLAVAEPPQQPDPGGPGEAFHQQPEVAPRQVRGAGRGQGRGAGEGVRGPPGFGVLQGPHIVRGQLPIGTGPQIHEPVQQEGAPLIHGGDRGGSRQGQAFQQG